MTIPTRLGLCAVLCALAILIPAAAVNAQQTLPPADPQSIWTIQGENASISTAALTDRYYVNGLRLGWTSGTSGVPDALAGIGRAVWGDGRQRISFDLQQQIFAPADTVAVRPPPGDRPYAGILTANLGLLSDQTNSRSTLGLQLGVLGPWALGEQVQNGFHDLIGQRHDNGWHYQLKNEPAIQLLSTRTWRIGMGNVAGLQTDALPNLEAGLGTLRIYAQSGVSIRLGQGLDSDYGVARVRPGPSGGDAFTPTRPLAWYVFAGADGQAVAHDVTLNGNTWQSSPSVKLLPFVAEFEVGLAIMAYGTRITYTQMFQTQEFQHQKGGLHQFGSLAASVRF
jgi:lipid A 3-O-deacylase